mmetsp:Transcript_17625/g.20400  ORF Transcript_17625/g.20400 Transcript_17625/m.20400 type:complete len:86 (-) Transcript_17625:307-564(-)
MTSIPVKEKVSSDKRVYSVIQKGLMERGTLFLGVGVAAGALASVVLARGSTSRKVITAFGGGVGLGSAWTRTNLELEEMLNSKGD